MYADKGIVADGAGSNEAKNKPEEDEKKKKEEEEKNKDEEKKKQEEDKKKKEDERKSLMVKAKSHGEVNKISGILFLLISFPFFLFSLFFFPWQGC